MGRFLNSGSAKFRQSLNTPVFVDKSELLHLLNNRIDSRNKYLCISRPRRFGKSFNAEMICAYYSKNNDSSALFDNLKISAVSSYREHLNQHHTIFLNMQLFLSNADGNVSDMLTDIDKSVAKELKNVFPDLGLPSDTRLNVILSSIFSREEEDPAKKADQKGFIFIIDEWDCVMREKAHDADGIRIYLDYLRALLKDQAYVSLAYMTGILPIKKYGTHSALNMFKEFSMTESGDYAPYFGFTSEEVLSLCAAHETDPVLMQKWYDGYAFRTISHIYNPNSVASAIDERHFASYWTQTETYESLKKYIDLNLEGLRDDVVRLVAGEDVIADTATFHNDMTTMQSKDDVLTLLVHLGYLTTVPDSKLSGADNLKIFAVRIPNEEIRMEFRTTLKNNKHYKGVYELIKKTEELMEYILNGNEAEVARLFDEAHQDHTSILSYNDENSLACVVALSLQLTTADIYSVYREMPAGKGFADMVYLPKPGVDKPALLMELKCDANAITALDQIKDKNYPQVLKGYRGEIILVGVSYSKKTKIHQCKISRITK